MSDSLQENGKKKFVRKAGKTLLVKEKEGSKIDESWFTSLDGLVSHYKTEKTGSYFLTFKDVGVSLDALKKLKNEHDNQLMVKFAHYRVFFKFANGLNAEQDYDLIKQSHIDFVKKHTDSEVLYYKLYRGKDNNFLGCGDMTLDTKDAIDKLLSKDAHKEFELEDGITGIFYRYDRKVSKQQGELQLGA